MLPQPVAQPPRLWSKYGPDERWDAIVIGSGMGGMTAAAMLSRLGWRVLVLEQHFVPGGFTQTFRRSGYIWDVGVHAVGEVGPDAPSGRLFNDLTGGRLEWAALGSVYDRVHFPGGLEASFPDNRAGFRDELLRIAPDERAAIDGYLARVERDAEAMRSFYRMRVLPGRVGRGAEAMFARTARRAVSTITAQVLREVTSSERLRLVLAAQWGYYGLVPSRSSWAMHALVTRHFLDGAWYPKGGAQALARALLAPVFEAGGWTRVATPVERILIDRGRVTGVKLDSGESVRAPVVISAVGATATVHRLLPDNARSSEWASSLGSLAAGPAYVSLYMGLRGDIGRAGATAANDWYYESTDIERSKWEVTPDGPLPDSPVLYASFPTLKDPSYDPGPDQRHTGEITTFVPWAAFERWRGTRWLRRGPEYKSFKGRLTDHLLEQFLRHKPNLAPFIDRVELSTPLSTDFFTRAVDGSMYGLQPTPGRFQNKWLRPGTPVKGLYLAGSDVGSMGIMGAMTGGMMAAAAAAPRAALPYLRRLSV